MKYNSFLLAVAVLIFAWAGCRPCCFNKETQVDSASVKEPVKTEKPLLLDDEPLLLLDDEPLLLLDDPADHGDADTADNSRCFVCHINYAKEDIAVVHARHDMGCAYCHGESDEHIADESWASGGNGTAPDKIYTKDKVNSFCLHCHNARDLPKKPHRILFTNPPPDKYCTDCHGEHLLEERKTKWK